MTGHAVFGIFSTRQSVEDAVTALRGANFRGSDISILAPDNLGDFRDIATVKHTKAPEGAVVGVVVGFLMGGFVGWLGANGLIPHLDTYLSAGLTMEVLAGIGAFGVIGAILGAIAGAGIPEYEAKRFETRLRKAGILLSVHADGDEWSRRAKDIFKQTGAKDIASVVEKRAA